jgi:hypothetical protein
MPLRRRAVRIVSLAIAAVVAAVVAVVTYPASAAVTGSDLQLTIDNIQGGQGDASARFAVRNLGPDKLFPGARITLLIEVPDTIRQIIPPAAMPCTPGVVGVIGRKVCSIQYSEENLLPNRGRRFQVRFIGTWQPGAQITFSIPIAVSLNDPNPFNFVTASLP